MVLPIQKALMVIMIMTTTIKCTQLIEEVTLVFYDIICKYSYTQILLNPWQSQKSQMFVKKQLSPFYLPYKKWFFHQEKNDACGYLFANLAKNAE